jgi:hypothetical protein
MVAKERRLGAKINTFDASSLNSQVARVVAQAGMLSYRLGLVLATLSLLLASAFAALTPEPLAFRMLSVLVLGVLPGLAAWTIGWTLLWILRTASVGCDLVVMLLEPKYRVIAATTSRVTISLARLAQGIIVRFVWTIKALPADCRYSLERVIATAKFYSVRTVRGFILAYQHLLMVVTSPVRLVARILISIIPQPATVARGRESSSRHVGPHSFARTQSPTSYRHR